MPADTLNAHSVRSNDNPVSLWIKKKTQKPKTQTKSAKSAFYMSRM